MYSRLFQGMNLSYQKFFLLGNAGADRGDYRFRRSAPLTNDKKTLYYHANENGVFTIFKASR
jgi:hypothetical protein